ncbi:MAG: hypothetical protein EXQ85_08080 [Alphaproteobacteria bacterium]|nr:hypothetical protein [Alphaproteobacteria bacterium]
MIHRVLMPRLGANIDTVKVIAWLKKIGDDVRKGDILAELETEKSSFELEAEESGVLRHIAVEAGNQVAYNVPLAIIAGQDADISSALAELSTAESSSVAFVKKMDESVFDAVEKAGKAAPGKVTRALATPRAQAMASTAGIEDQELSGIAAGLPRGFATERDIEAYLALVPTYIYGASTGALQIMEIVRSGTPCRLVGIIDDNPDLHGRQVRGVEVLGGIDLLADLAAKARTAVVVASHSNNRRKIFEKLATRVPGVDLPPVVDRRAVLLSGVTVGPGCLIEAGCIVGHDVSLGQGAILNIGAKLSHNCAVGAFSHLAIGTSISGAVSIGRNCLIGAGSAINPAVAIGDNVIVMPGSSVMNDLPADVTAGGNPARVVGESKRGTA